MKIQKIIKNNKGYTLLFAVLVSAIVLSVGISILTISRKESQLASAARGSTSAFYAADTGVECATYYNDNGDHFNISSPSINTISCGGYNQPANLSAGSSYSFSLPAGTNGACAIVTVTKYTTSSGEERTTILSKGYNLGWVSPVCGDNTTISPNRVERAIQTDY